MKPEQSFAWSAALLAVWSGAAAALQAGPPVEELIGMDGQPPNGHCVGVDLSHTGRYLGFSCLSGEVAGRELIHYEPFVFDRATRTIHRIHIDTQGAIYSAGGSGSLVSDDGAQAVFISQMPLHPDVPPPPGWLPARPSIPYLRDLKLGMTEPLGRDPSGAALRWPASAHLQDAAMERHLVLFAANADLRDPAQPRTTNSQLYVRDWVSGSLDLVTARPDGAVSEGGGIGATLSYDGRYVAFESASTDLGSENPTGTPQLFLRDRVLRTTRRLSRPLHGGEFTTSYWQSSNAYFTADARTLVLASNSDELVAGDAPGRLDIFTVDTTTGRYTLLTRAHDGGPANEASFSPVVSADGRYVAFFSRATNLLPQPQSQPGVYVLDRYAGELVNVSASLPPLAQYHVSDIVISGDGSTIVFDWRTPTGIPLRPWDYALYTVTLRGGPVSPPVAVPATASRAGMAVLLALTALLALRRRASA